MKSRFFFGRNGIDVEVPDTFRCHELRSRKAMAVADETAAVNRALDHPIACEPLAEVARGKKTERIELARALPTRWSVRVGIHVGPVVAGVIGRRQYLFDLWGDTVNTAARIEEYGRPGSVNVSGRAWLQLRNRAQGRSLGFVDLKGKEKIEVVECVGLRE